MPGAKTPRTRTDPLTPAEVAKRMDERMDDATLARIAEDFEIPPETLDDSRPRSTVLRTEPPVPESYRWCWWPASVTLPESWTNLGDPTVIETAKVYATAAGLYVYTAPNVLAFYAPMDYSNTAQPVGVHPANKRTVRVALPDGEQVVVQPLNSCGCGNPLKAWRPNWAGKIEAWSAR